MELTPKERILRSIKGEEVDRPAWSPFLAYWWGSNPATKNFSSELECLKACGADPMLRGNGSAWNIEYHGTEINGSYDGADYVEKYSTPVGELIFRSRYSAVGNTTFLYDHPIKTAEDLKILSWIFEHAEIHGSGDADRLHREVGEDALIMPLVGAGMKTCFESLVERWVGVVNLAYLIEDAPDEIDYCINAMRRVSDLTAKYAAQTECEAFIFWEDTSTTTQSPAMFAKYASPEINAWGNTLHAAGKLLVHHACGHLRTVLPLMAQNSVDAIESISPPPTGNIDIAEAFGLLPDNIALIGGIESVFFENCTNEELEARARYLLKIGEGRRFVLANSDSCPPGVAYEKFRFVSELVRNAE